MNAKLLERLVQFRHELHSYPQTSMNEFQTRQRIKKILFEFGVQEHSMKELNPTALVVDLAGQLKEQGEDRCIAFRADMDALSMTEDNPHLEYKSKNEGAAHMCGHDGHMTCLIGFVPLFLQHLKQIPKNKKIRLLFQPSEEGPVSGAKLMIEQGCLEGVDEVYGFHNWPIGSLGQLYCKEGAVMSEVTLLKIKIIGTGGHGSEPETLKVALWAGIQFYQRFLAYLEELKKEKKDLFICTLPVFHSGERYNVIADRVMMEGTIRSFEEGLNHIIIKKIYELLEQFKGRGFSYEFTPTEQAPAIINTKDEAEHVLRVAAEHFGKDKVGHGRLPFKASEDFSFFLKHRKGAFFFLLTGSAQNQPFLHNSHFNFNDSLIEKAATFWVKLALDRLNVKIQ